MSKTTKETLENNLSKAQDYVKKLQKQLEAALEKETLAANKLTEFERKATEEAEKAAANPNKVNKTGAIPVRQLAIADLGQRVPQNWATKFPTMQIPQINQNDVMTKATTMADLVQQSVQNAADKKTNTDELAAINKQINAAVSQLKRNLAAIYSADVLNGVYQNYGLVINSKKMYDLPLDNTARMANITILVNKLQEVGNPLAQLPNFNLRQWLQWQRDHKELWEKSNFLREEKSRYVSEIDAIYQVLRNDLRVIYDYVPFVYPAQQVKSIRRQLGFLRESF